jgi:hypothetical protein
MPNASTGGSNMKIRIRVFFIIAGIILDVV